MRCANCGAKNPDSNRFCVNCGMPLAAADAGASNLGGYTPPEPTGYTPPEPAGYTPPEPAGYTPPEPTGYAPPEPIGNTPPEEPDIGFRPMPPGGQGGGGKLGDGGKGGRKARAGSMHSGPGQSYGPGGRVQRPVRGGSRLPLFIGIGVLALALIGGGLYFFLGRGKLACGGDTPTPIAIQTAAPGEKRTPEQVEAAVTDIRSRYNEIMSAVSAGTYTSRTQDDVTMYFDGNDVKCIAVPGGTNGSTYSRWFYFDGGQLFFAYYEGKDAHRLYFKDDVMLRWRYCTDKDQPDSAENYDQLDTEAYRAKQEQVLEDARRFYP